MIPILDGDEVRRRLPMARAVAAVREAMVAMGRGEVDQPVRTALALPGSSAPGVGGGTLLVKPGAIQGDRPAVATKLVSVVPGNPARGLPAIQGVVVVFDPDDGRPVAVLDAAVVTEIRTAAASAVATDLLAAPKAGDLAILGAGVQARSHLEAMALVRDLRRVRVWNRTRARADELADWAHGHLAGLGADGVPVEVCDTVDRATDGADLLCTVTSSRSPILSLSDVGPGAHVNAVGAFQPDARELASDLVSAARLVVDHREAARAESGTLLLATEDGHLDPDVRLDELGELLAGGVRFTRDPDDRTVFFSLGLAIQDVAAAAACLDG